LAFSWLSSWGFQVGVFFGHVLPGFVFSEDIFFWIDGELFDAIVRLD